MALVDHPADENAIVIMAERGIDLGPIAPSRPRGPVPLAELVLVMESTTARPSATSTPLCAVRPSCSATGKKGNP